jgi:hypothetical protein
VAGRLGEVAPYETPGSALSVLDLPERLSADGYPIGILTHAPGWYVKELSDVFGIRADARITGSDPYPSKPDPASLLALAAHLGVVPTDVVFLGDSDVDFEAAAAAGAVSVGACWSRQAPQEWRRHWPDIAISRPDRMLDVLADGPRLAPFGEVLVGSLDVRWHWGSLIRLGDGVFAAGRYFSVSDDRHAHHPLSQLVLDAKGGGPAATDMAAAFGVFAERRAEKGISFDLIASVPPKPGQDNDRFEPSRELLAEIYGGHTLDGELTMVRDVEGYRNMDHDSRGIANRDRFAAQNVEGQRILLLEDVLSSGGNGQAEACRSALLDAGASEVIILGLTVTQERLARQCPECGGVLRVINGRRGRFVGCPNYFTTGCPYTEDLPG